MRTTCRICSPSYLVLVVALAHIPLRCAWAQSPLGTFEKTLIVAGAAEIVLANGYGAITFEPGEAGIVRLTGTVSASPEWDGGSEAAEAMARRLLQSPPVEQQGDVIRIGDIMEDPTLRQAVAIEYKITVPVNTRVTSANADGDQTVHGLRGPIKISSGSGKVRITNVEGDVRASSGSGDIYLSAISGRIQANTSEGTIQVENLTQGDVQIASGSGRVLVSGVRGALRVASGSGNVTARGNPTADWRFRTGSGNITVELPHDAAFDFFACTESGHISFGIPLANPAWTGKTEVRGQVRGGGPLVRVETESGQIRIRNR